VVTEMGRKVDPLRDQITVDGQLLRLSHRPAQRYLMLYKPPGYLSVFDDSRGRPGLEALVQAGERLFPVGRLDLDSEGLLLLTNDGELSQRLSHPRYEHGRLYLVLVHRRPGSDDLARLSRGIELEEGITAPSDWRILEQPPRIQPLPEGDRPEGVWLRVRLREGRKRQIRRMAAARGLHVRRLIRVGLGPLRLDRQLKPGEHRPLNRSELQQLREVTRSPSRAARRSTPNTKSKARKRKRKH
jgi:23S rRNA pseudouridine2605 synthase